MTMSKRALGDTGIQVSCLGLGTVKFGRNEEVKYPTGFSLPSDREVESLLDIAAEHGINLIDTAPAYGSSEQRIGRLLKNRHDWIISTKVGEQFITGKSVFDFSKAKTRESVEKSLRYLATDYLDIVLIHSDGRDNTILDSGECLQALVEMKEAGKIRAIGMSTKTVEGAIKAVEVCDVLMLTLNPSATQDQVAIDLARQENKGVLIKKAFESGHVNNGSTSASPEGNLKFALDTAGVSSVIVGTINKNHLIANALTATSL